MANVKILYTVLIFTGQFTFSLLAGIIAPALIDLRLLLLQNGTMVSLRSVALMFTFYFVGSILGSFISILYKSARLQGRINRQLVTSLLVLIFALSVGLLPYGRSIWALYGLITLGGIGCSNWNVVATTWLIELWNGRPQLVASMLQAQQFAFGLGATAAPLVVKPYLSGVTQSDADLGVLSREEIEARRGRLAVPFAFCAGIEGAVGLILLFTYLLKATRYKRKVPTGVPPSLVSSKVSDGQRGSTGSSSIATVDSANTAPNCKLLDTAQNSSASSVRTLFKLAFIVIFTFFSVSELGHISFQNTYLQLLPGLNISAQEAAEIATITAVTYTVGRAVSVPISGLLSSGTILNVHLALCLLAFGAFFWSSSQGDRLWLAANSALAGYALSPIRSSMFAYVNAYTTADDRLNALFFISICIGSVFSPLVIGPYIAGAPSVLIYVDLVSISVALVAFIAVQVLICRQSSSSVHKSQITSTVEQAGGGGGSGCSLQIESIN